MAGNEIAQLAAVIKLNDGNVGQKLELIKKGLGQTDSKFDSLTKSVSNTAVKVNTLKIELDKTANAAKNSEKVTKDLKAENDKLNQSFNTVNIALDKVQKEFDKSSTKINNSKRVTASAKAKNQELEKTLNNLKNKVAAADLELNKHNSMLKQSEAETKKNKDRVNELNNSYNQNKLALAQSKLELQKYNVEQKAAATEGTGLTGVMSKMGLTMTGVLIGGLVAVTAGLGALLVKTTQTAGEFEQLAVSFDVLIGNSTKAAAFTDELIQLANVTPMTTQGLAKNAQMLLAMGESLQNVIPDLKMLGDISGGNQEKMNSLALVFGQVGARGRLTGDNLRQMTELGFNPLNLIAKKTGETMGQVTDRMEKGNVSFSEFKDTMIVATSEGGRFYGMMNKQSQTLQGRLSTMADKWQLVAKNIGDIFLPVAKAAVMVLVKLGDAVLNLQAKMQKFTNGLRDNGGTDSLKNRVSAYKQEAATLNKLAKEADARGATDRAASYRKQANEWLSAASKAEKQLSQVKKQSETKVDDVSTGFSDSLKEPKEGKGKRAKAGKSADSNLNDKIQMIKAVSDYEIANSKMTDEQILQKKIETQNKITALYKKGSVEYINSQTTSLEFSNQIEDLKTKKAAEEAQKKKELIQKGRDEEAAAAKQVSDGITDSLKSAVDGTKTLSEAFKDMLATMAINIVRSGLEKKLAALLSGFSTSAMGGTGVISNWLGTVNPLLGKAASFLGFANGGNPPINKPFMVGERGPEIMQVGSSSKVWSNKESQGMTSGEGSQGGQGTQNVLINHNINIKAFDSQDVVRTLQKGESKSAIIGITKEAIRNNTGGMRSEIKNA